MAGMMGGSPGRAFLARLPEMVTISGPDGGIIYANPATERVSGFTPEEFAALDPFGLIHPEERLLAAEAFERLASTPGLSLELEYRIMRKDGTWRWVEGTFINLFDDPEVGGLLATVRDVTERKRAEVAVLRAGEERQLFLLKLNDALRPLGDPVAIIATATRVLGEHLAADRVLYAEHVRNDDEDHWLIENVYHLPDYPFPDGLYPLQSFGRDAYEALKGNTVIVNDVSNDAGISPAAKATFKATSIAAYVALPLIKEGKFVALLALHQASPREWTPEELELLRETAERTWAAVERARSSKALRASEEKYHTLFESIDEGFCIVEVIFDGTGKPVDYRFLEVNPAFERHTGLRDAMGKRMRELEPRHEEHWFEIYGRIATTGQPERFTNAAKYLGGRFYDVYAFRIGAPEERKVAILFTDITRRKEAEEERLRLRTLEASARAEAAERERISRELHDRVAHTMGVAHQSLQLHEAYAKSDPPRAAEKLRLATEATKTALDQTRALSAQLARLATEETRYGVGAALRDLLDTHVTPGVEATLSVAGAETAVPPHVAEQAYLVMREAVRNAIAHSGCGRIEVSLRVDELELRGRVEDDGSGFDPLGVRGGERDDQGNDTPTAGVGLRSMRERAEALGGRVYVFSEPGRGTAVELQLPLAD